MPKNNNYQCVGRFSGREESFNQGELLRKKVILQEAACNGISLLMVKNKLQPESTSPFVAVKYAASFFKKEGTSELNMLQSLTFLNQLYLITSVQKKHNKNFQFEAFLNENECRMAGKAQDIPTYKGLLTLIARNPANIYYIVGDCEGVADGKQYSGAHAFVIIADEKNQEYEFFEANRGRAVFPSKEHLLSWLAEEIELGAMPELRTLSEVREGVTRQYTSFDCAAYTHPTLAAHERLVAKL
ncbi:MAG: hypothetical protein HKM04_01685 [Legionellales bacterium]|nr:hypothetical protein [Legionellales bacterium]